MRNEILKMLEKNSRIELKDMAEYLGKQPDTVRKQLKKHGGFQLSDGLVTRRVGAAHFD